MSITTILQIYRRPNYLSEQLAAIAAQTIKSDKLIIVQNKSDVEFDFSKYSFPENTQFITSDPNAKYHLRFAIGLLTDTDYLFFFDDDSIPGNRFFESAIKLIEEKNCIVVGNGRIIHAEERKWNCPGWGNPTSNGDVIECDFGGHVWGLKQEHLKYMWYENPLRYDNCEDMQLSFNCFRFGGIRTFVAPHPISDKSVWSSLKGAEYGSDSVASWIVNLSHFQDRWDTIDKYIENGYLSLVKRS